MSFARHVVIETTHIGRHRVVGTVREAAECLIACQEALNGDADTESARGAFIAAAKEVGVFVRKAALTGLK